MRWRWHKDTNQHDDVTQVLDHDGEEGNMKTFNFWLSVIISKMLSKRMLAGSVSEIPQDNCFVLL